MKQITLLIAFLGLTMFSADAQRVVCVDIAAILDNMTEYKEAQTELDQTAAKWKQQIDLKRDEIRGLYNKYQSEVVLLSDEQKTQREDEIMKKEQAMREYQKQKFGPDGALFKKRQELVRPIQDKVYQAIERYAERKGYDFIFDKAGSAGILFTNPKYDKTNDIQNLLNKK